MPPYSPDLNPIELCFVKLKALVRTARCRSSETLWPFFGTCLEHFSPDECRNYFRHGGYSAAIVESSVGIYWRCKTGRIHRVTARRGSKWIDGGYVVDTAP